ncbi:hypothetical protein J7376_17115 [Paracoccus sp. R12_1]|uniref:Uncharacterized protein n=1 Tax=Paracoccus maritimus TaxID=2933292 RepID=A0ABT2KFF8_9RHOB|nr:MULTISPECIES: hypothetical protein [unclassified Paracoccus (in: a-proteobacteria)]MBO9456626.1 hypothetical protein [Paracoccus sp. R12_2]MBO9488236.1 hypothetical protein [Paracoccus sp. R12_1]MCT4334724.1 hypothetical protein [Paracoccus sp. YLB-12]
MEAVHLIVIAILNERQRRRNPPDRRHARQCAKDAIAKAQLAEVESCLSRLTGLENRIWAPGGAVRR